jgi:hypothetical protein
MPVQTFRYENTKIYGEQDTAPLKLVLGSDHSDWLPSKTKARITNFVNENTLPIFLPLYEASLHSVKTERQNSEQTCALPRL